MIGLARTAQISGWQTYGGGFTNPLTTWTAQGAAELSTAQFKFGTASLYTDSDQSSQSDFNASSGDRTFLDIGSGDFTISFWFRMTSGTSTNKHQDCLANNTINGIGLRFGKQFLSATRNGFGIFARQQADLDQFDYTWNDDTWYWVVTQRSGTTITFWVDGTQQTRSDGPNGTAGSRTFANWDGSSEITMGSAQGTDGSRFVYFDELNITVGSALYPTSGSITVPTAPFTVQQYTTQLVHWDGSNGATTCDNDQG